MRGWSSPWILAGGWGKAHLDCCAVRTYHGEGQSSKRCHGTWQPEDSSSQHLADIGIVPYAGDFTPFCRQVWQEPRERDCTHHQGSGEDTDAQRGSGTRPRSHSWHGLELGVTQLASWPWSVCCLHSPCITCGGTVSMRRRAGHCPQDGAGQRGPRCTCRKGGAKPALEEQRLEQMEHRLV